MQLVGQLNITAFDQMASQPASQQKEKNPMASKQTLFRISLKEKSEKVRVEKYLPTTIKRSIGSF